MAKQYEPLTEFVADLERISFGTDTDTSGAECVDVVANYFDSIKRATEERGAMLEALQLCADRLALHAPRGNTDAIDVARAVIAKVQQ
jgi:hypothetical protein